MQVPVRALDAIRPQEHPGLLLGTAYATAVLSVGPFLLPAVATSYGIGLGTRLVLDRPAARWVRGRLLRCRSAPVAPRPHPRRRRHRRGRRQRSLRAAPTLRAAHRPPLRRGRRHRGHHLVLVGAGLRRSAPHGRDRCRRPAGRPHHGADRRRARRQLTGPRASTSRSPSPPWCRWRSAGGAEPAIACWPLATAEAPRHAATAEARRILGCLGLLTLGGSSVFTFGAVIARDTTSLSTEAIALAFSANAVASIPSAPLDRTAGPRRNMAARVRDLRRGDGHRGGGRRVRGGHRLLGLRLLDGRARRVRPAGRPEPAPEERAGDAQAVMAAGRVVGPARRRGPARPLRPGHARRRRGRGDGRWGCRALDRRSAAALRCRHRSPSSVAAVEITPDPTPEETAAIVAAIQVSWPSGEASPPEPTPRWRFSGRWWSQPIPLRRNRPW